MKQCDSTSIMLQFTSCLKKEVDAEIEKIECSETCMINKSLEASRILIEAFARLKEFILSYEFKNDDEEILFFKVIKPTLCFRLIYYRKVYNIEMNRPIGIDKQREYLNEILESINRYNAKRLDFIRYYRSCSSHLDELYFLRGKSYAEQYLETSHYEFDPQFSTNCDFKVAKILSNDMLSAYLMHEIESLNDNGTKTGRSTSLRQKRHGKGPKPSCRNRFTPGTAPDRSVMCRLLSSMIISKTFSTSSWTAISPERSAT